MVKTNKTEGLQAQSATVLEVSPDYPIGLKETF